LNKGSCHTSACFKSIPSGVIRRLSILTALTQENENVPINELYPEHAKALEIAHLHVPLPYPTLRESIKAINAKKLQAEEKILAIHHPSLLAGKDDNVIGKDLSFSAEVLFMP
jgi:hypothetical protein